MCRQRVSRRQGKLSQDRIDRLNKLPFSWSGTEAEFDKDEQLGWETAHTNYYTKEWHDKVKELTEHKEKFGHMRVSRVSNQPLTHWIFRQRRLCAEGMLCEERVSKLNNIGFVWRVRKCSAVSPSDERWTEMYERLKAFKKEHGHFDTASQCCSDHELTKWVRVQMSLQWSSRPERKAMLEDLGFPLEQCYHVSSLPLTRSAKRKRTSSNSDDDSEDEDVTRTGGKSHSERATGSRGVHSDRILLDEAKHDGAALLAVRSTRIRPTRKASTRDDSATTKTANEKRASPPKTDILPPQADHKHPVGTQIRNFFPGHGWYKGIVQIVGKQKYTVLIYEDGDVEEFLIGGPTMDALVELAKSHPNMGIVDSARATAMGSSAYAPTCDRNQGCSGGQKRLQGISKETGLANEKARRTGIDFSKALCNMPEGKVESGVLERDEVGKVCEADSILSLKAKCVELEISLKRSNKAVAVAKTESTRLQRLNSQLQERIEVLEGNQFATGSVAQKVLSRLHGKI